MKSVVFAEKSPRSAARTHFIGKHPRPLSSGGLEGKNRGFCTLNAAFFGQVWGKGADVSHQRPETVEKLGNLSPSERKIVTKETHTRMNEDCKKGLVKTVIVKDLSRFGREHIGAAESLKTTRLTFKSKKRVPSPKERRAIIEDSHEPIIDSLVWEKVKALRQNKRRPTYEVCPYRG